MTEIAIDIGNTRLKAGRFESGELSESLIFPDGKELLSWLSTLSDVKQVVIGSVGKAKSLIEEISKQYDVYIAQTNWEIPLEVQYESIETLGIDRLAAVVGAWTKFEEAVIVFDIGSCMTIDRVDEKGVYTGGNISPGWQMRLKAMHHFTANLPQVDLKSSNQFLGKNTVEALQLGAFNGLKFEIEAYIARAKQRNEQINVILTGGNAFEFANSIKMEIFVLPDIILEGLHKLLHANT